MDVLVRSLSTPVPLEGILYFSFLAAVIGLSLKFPKAAPWLLLAALAVTFGGDRSFRPQGGALAETVGFIPALGVMGVFLAVLAAVGRYPKALAALGAVAVLALLVIGWVIYIVWVIVGAAMARTVWVIVLHDD